MKEGEFQKGEHCPVSVATRRAGMEVKPSRNESEAEDLLG
jgi:hypothetical protein